MAVAIAELLVGRLVTFFGLASTAGSVIAPFTTELAQANWFAHPTRALSPELAANMVSQGVLTPGRGADEAAQSGIDRERFAAMVDYFNDPPGAATLIELYQRGLASRELARQGLIELGIEDKYFEAILDLVALPLSPADVANAIQQGFLEGPNPSGDKINPGPIGTFNAVEEAKKSGIDANRLEVLTALAGLPPGPQELLDMHRRGIISESDVLAGIRQGHTKTAWGPKYLQMLNRPLHADELANLVIREWLTIGEAHAQAPAAGVSPETIDRLVQLHGRPPGPAQLQMMVNRGLIDETRFGKGIAESDVRTEWTDVLYAMRVRYPSSFALRQMLSSGTITPAQGADILVKEGWERPFAEAVAKAWADQKSTRLKQLTQDQIAVLYESRYLSRGQAGEMLAALGFNEQQAGYELELADARRVKRFLDTAVGAIHTRFVRHFIPEGEAVSALHSLGLASEAVDDLLATWRLEQSVSPPVVTPAELATAANYGVITAAQAIDRIASYGYSRADAELIVYTRLHGRPAG